MPCDRRSRPIPGAPAHCPACDGAADFDDVESACPPLVFDTDGNLVSGRDTLGAPGVAGLVRSGAAGEGRR